MSTSIAECTVCNCMQANLLCCFLCQSSVHAFDCGDKKKLCTSSLYNMLDNASKLYPNFFYICNSCKSNKEVSVNSPDQSRMCDIEKKVDRLELNLNEIKNLIESKGQSQQSAEQAKGSIHASVPTALVIGECWSNEEKMVEIRKARVSKSALVIPKSPIDTTLEKTIVDSNVQISKSFKNKSGETIIVCDSASSRDKLSTAITNNCQNWNN
ncbi:hypothetical protein BSL78_24083 [Apostichopus japonicus]|uniref:Uncharacterized protein n=1 Tax=Stichopus japonicus TaxID=307972 RepID=A0A2G8JTI6_STIJA|nr:hypothetical protein BSL78_24083 [Apostichopus japonicus]